jgi:hypothetical protein
VEPVGDAAGGGQQGLRLPGGGRAPAGAGAAAGAGGGAAQAAGGAGSSESDGGGANREPGSFLKDRLLSKQKAMDLRCPCLKDVGIFRSVFCSCRWSRLPVPSTNCVPALCRGLRLTWFRVDF